LEYLITNVKKLRIDGQILMHDLTEDMLKQDLKVSRLHTAKFLRELKKLRGGDYEEVEAQGVQMDWTINTFGFGSQHNSDLLEKLAERFDGMYYFIKDNDAINECFATCLGGLMSIVATNLQLKVMPLNGAKNVKILNDVVVKLQDSAVFASLGDIQSEQKRHILFELDLPKVKAESGADSYCSVELSYENTISSNSDVLHSLMQLKRGTVTRNRDNLVDEQHNRLVVAHALQNADALGRAGHLEQARAKLDNAIRNVRSSSSSLTLMSRNLVNDMTETKKGYASMNDYKKWGNQITKTKNLSILRERAVRVSNSSNQYSLHTRYSNNSQRTILSQFNENCSDDSDSLEHVRWTRQTLPTTRQTLPTTRRVIGGPKSSSLNERLTVNYRPQVRPPVSMPVLSGALKLKRGTKFNARHKKPPHVRFVDSSNRVFKRETFNSTDSQSRVSSLSSVWPEPAELESPHVYEVESSKVSLGTSANAVMFRLPFSSLDEAESAHVHDTNTEQNEEKKDSLYS